MATERALGTLAGVEALTNPPPSGAYTTTTQPTLAQVEGFLDQVIDEMYAEFDAKGIVTPITETSTVRLAAIVNNYGAAAIAYIRQHRLPSPAETKYGEWLQEQYEKKKEKFINDFQLDADAVDGERKKIPKSEALYSRVKEKYVTDYDPEDIEPHFKRGMEF